MSGSRWVITPSSRSSYIVANGKISFFFYGWYSFLYMYIYPIFIHSPISRHLACFPYLGKCNNATENIDSRVPQYRPHGPLCWGGAGFCACAQTGLASGHVCRRGWLLGMRIGRAVPWPTGYLCSGCWPSGGRGLSAGDWLQGLRRFRTTG